MKRLIFYPETILFKISYVLLALFLCSGGTIAKGSEGQRELHLEVFLQGLYDKEKQQMSEASGFNDSGPYPAIGEGIADVVTISLHETVDYSKNNWGEHISHQIQTELGCDGTATADLPPATILSGTYWLSVSHRNHVETVYHEPVDLSGQGPYSISFITNNALQDNQAYLGEIVRSGESIHAYAMYAGDLNGDGLINITDRSLLTTQLSLGIRGYVREDINGDGMVTIADRTLLQKNLSLGIRSINPQTIVTQ